MLLGDLQVMSLGTVMSNGTSGCQPERKSCPANYILCSALHHVYPIMERGITGLEDGRLRDSGHFCALPETEDSKDLRKKDHKVQICRTADGGRALVGGARGSLVGLVGLTIPAVGPFLVSGADPGACGEGDLEACWGKSPSPAWLGMSDAMRALRERVRSAASDFRSPDSLSDSAGRKKSCGKQSPEYFSTANAAPPKQATLRRNGIRRIAVNRGGTSEEAVPPHTRPSGLDWDVLTQPDRRKERLFTNLRVKGPTFSRSVFYAETSRIHALLGFC